MCPDEMTRKRERHDIYIPAEVLYRLLASGTRHKSSQRRRCGSEFSYIALFMHFALAFEYVYSAWKQGNRNFVSLRKYHQTERQVYVIRRKGMAMFVLYISSVWLHYIYQVYPFFVSEQWLVRKHFTILQSQSVRRTINCMCRVWNECFNRHTHTQSHLSSKAFRSIWSPSGAMNCNFIASPTGARHWAETKLFAWVTLPEFGRHHPSTRNTFFFVNNIRVMNATSPLPRDTFDLSHYYVGCACKMHI